jgi:hypothetical protein
VRIPRPSGLLAALAVAALLSGCTTEEAGTASPADTSTGSSPASTSVADGAAPSAPALESAVVQESDLPRGWTAEPYEDDSDDEDQDQQAALLECVGARDTSSEEVDEVHSPDFTTDTGSTISSSATTYRSQDAIDDDVAALTGPAVSGCFTEAFGQLADSQDLPAGTTVGDAQFTVAPGSAAGPTNIVAIGSGTIPMTVSGRQISLYIDVVFMTGRLTQAQVGFIGIGAPVPDDLQSSVVTAMADRVGAL